MSMYVDVGNNLNMSECLDYVETLKFSKRTNFIRSLIPALNPTRSSPHPFQSPSSPLRPPMKCRSNVILVKDKTLCNGCWLQLTDTSNNC